MVNKKAEKKAELMDDGSGTFDADDSEAAEAFAQDIAQGAGVGKPGCSEKLPVALVGESTRKETLGLLGVEPAKDSKNKKRIDPLVEAQAVKKGEMPVPKVKK